MLALAEPRGIAVVEDAAHAVGGTLDGRACGSFGDIGCFSFFSNKNLPVGEGGMVVTDDDELAARLRLLRSHGMTTLTWDRHRGHAAGYDVVASGFNYRLDELRAALAPVQLGRLAERNDARRAQPRRYRDRARRHRTASSIAVRRATTVPIRRTTSPWSLLPPDVDREGVRDGARRGRIQTSVHYPPIHGFTAYADAARAPLPRTDADRRPASSRCRSTRI